MKANAGPRGQDAPVKPKKKIRIKKTEPVVEGRETTENAAGEAEAEAGEAEAGINEEREPASTNTNMTGGEYVEMTDNDSDLE